MRTPRRLNPGLNFEACGGADGKKSRKIILRAAIRKPRSSFHTVCKKNALRLNRCHYCYFWRNSPRMN